MAEQVTEMSFSSVLSCVSSTLPNSSSRIKFIQFSFKRAKALLIPWGLKDLAFRPCFMKVCREVRLWLQHWDYAADTHLSQKMQIVVLLVFLMSEGNKHRDDSFQSRREAVSTKRRKDYAFLCCWGLLYSDCQAARQCLCPAGTDCFWRQQWQKLSFYIFI